VCDGTSAVGESRHRIPDDPLVNRLNLAAKLILDAAERRMLPVLDLDLSVAIGRCDLALQRWLAELENGSGVATLQSCFMTPKNFKLA